MLITKIGFEKKKKYTKIKWRGIKNAERILCLKKYI